MRDFCTCAKVGKIGISDVLRLEQEYGAIVKGREKVHWSSNFKLGGVFTRGWFRQSDSERVLTLISPASLLMYAIYVFWPKRIWEKPFEAIDCCIALFFFTNMIWKYMIAMNWTPSCLVDLCLFPLGNFLKLDHDIYIFVVDLCFERCMKKPWKFQMLFFLLKNWK